MSNGKLSMIKQLRYDIEKSIEMCEEIFSLEGRKTTIPKKWYQLREKKRFYTKAESEDNIIKRMNNIEEPIWTLCEKLLTGCYDYTKITHVRDCSTYRFNLLGVDLDVTPSEYFPMDITPKVWENEEEHLLLKKVLANCINYEDNTKHRDMMSLYIEEEKTNDE